MPPPFSTPFASTPSTGVILDPLTGLPEPPLTMEKNVQDGAASDPGPFYGVAALALATGTMS